MRDAVDFMSPPDPALLKQLDLDALPYTGNARPSADWFAEMKRRGLPVLTMIQETVSTRSQQGEQAGIYDCQFAESRAREVNPDVQSIAVVVSDGSWSDTWDCSPYGRGWASVASLRFFPYGATECCTSFIRGAHGVNQLCFDGEWIPETWGTGRLMTQVVGPSPVPDSDLNHVHADYTGGAVAPPKRIVQEDDVLYMHNKDGVEILRMGERHRRVAPVEWAALKAEFAFDGRGELKALPFDQEWFDVTAPGGDSGAPTHFTGTLDVKAA